jgi:predicted acyl esterase
MSKQTVAGIEPGQRQLNGPQTSGREYHDLSQPQYNMTSDLDLRAKMRDGIELLCDIFRPDEPGRYPVLIAASPYPRQLQNLGAPAGFIEAGASDFFVPRGYVHVIANLRGTGGSGGTFGFFDHQEREDMYDLVEWAAQQPWSDGNVGMLGISYFAGTQMEAAVMQPPHLKAIMPVAGTFDLYESAYHHGLFSSSFVTPFLSMIGMTSSHGNKLYRSKLIAAARKVLHIPGIHKKFATMNGEAMIAGLKILLKLHHDPHPWDDLWRAVAVEHPTRDAWWDDRNILPMLKNVKIPVYLGCDWQNVPLHLPHTFPAFQKLTHSPHVRATMLGEYGLTWPWESLHIEALAWFDQWLKGKETGILDGPRFRYILPGGDTWHTSDTWPIPEITYQSLALRADGHLSREEGPAGSRALMTLGAGLNRPRPSETDPSNHLTWETQSLTADLDLVGPIELRLEASSTAMDTAWIVFLQDVDPDGIVTDITAGYLRASLRQVDDGSSITGAPVLACRTPQPIPAGQIVNYRIPLVPNARRFKAGHKVRLLLTSDDQDQDMPAVFGFRHASIGTNCLSHVASSSRLLLPVLKS